MSTTVRVTGDEPRHQLRALYDLAVELSGLRDVASVLDVALRHCLDLTGSQFGFIGLVNPDRTAMEIAAIHGFHPSPRFFQRHRVIPLRPSVFATAVLEDQPVRSVDARTEPDRVGQPDGHPEVVTFLGVPLRLSGATIGMIGVANRSTPYERAHEDLITTYAGQVAIVIRNARLNEELEVANQHLERVVEERTAELHAAKDELAAKAADLQAVLTDTVAAQEAERQRIARDLHDGINQLLIGAMLELESSQQRLAAGNPTAARHAIASAQSIVKQVEAEIRRVVHDLHPPVLDELGLPVALRRLADEFGRLHGIDCTVTVRGSPRTQVSRRAAIDLYRLAQEALHNVGEHAYAGSVELTLAVEDGEATLVVRDDGRGFDPESVRRSADGNLGLTSMRQRAESRGGRLVIDAGPGRGTRVQAVVPIRG
jgi:signal transduction histidine kinase